MLRPVVLPLARCLAASVALVVAAGASPDDPAPPGRFLDVPQGRLWYDVHGSGEALVMIHDGLLPSATWDAQVEPLGRWLRVVRYDRRYYGQSTTTTREHSNLDDLLALIDHLKIQRAALMGCSSGGGLAIDFALAHPDRVSALVLVGPVVSGFGYSHHFRERGLRNLAPVYAAGDKEAALANWAADPYITDSRNTAARVRLQELLKRYPFSASGGDPGGRPPSRPALTRLGELRVPVLLITGASDIPDVHAHIGAIAAGIPGAERQVVAQAGHLVHLEQPGEFNRRVLDFLATPDYARDVLGKLREGAPDLAAFDYAPRAALDVQEAGRERRGDATVVDLSYASPRGGRVPAYLVLPDGPQRCPGLLFLHHGQGDRNTFLDEAVELAGRGYVSLLVRGVVQRRSPDPTALPFDAVRDRRDIEQEVVDLRRGLDLLAARPEVDALRLGYVGYSLGGTMGARLVGLEPRIRASVLVAGFPALTQALDRDDRRVGMAFRVLIGTAEGRRAYLTAVAPLDGVRFLDRRGGTPLLLQFARADEFISRLAAAVFEAGSGPRVTTSWHDGGHFELGAGPARVERREFLLRELAPAR